MYSTDYKELIGQTDALTAGVPHITANLANVSSLIYHTLEDVNWAGFYLFEGDRLVLGPFQGKTACIEIPFGKGVCGTALAEDRTLRIDDVHEFKGHIACDSASRSEIVVPLRRGSVIYGVLDIDSPVPSRFTKQDEEGLEALLRTLEKNIFLFDSV